MNWRTLITRLAPTALQQPWAQKFLYAPGLVLDGIQEWMNQGLNARMRSLADPSALPYTGRDMQIVQGFAEPSASFAIRLRRGFDDWAIAGSAWSVLRQLKAYLTGFAVQIATVTAARGTWHITSASGVEAVYRAVGNWNWQSDPNTLWSKAWVIIWPESSGVWTALGTCGGGLVCGTPGMTLGTTATPAQVSTVREIVRQWKGAGRTVVNIIIALDPASFDHTAAPGAPLPDGTWQYDGNYVGGTVQPARLLTARYWDGTSNTQIAT